MSAEKLAYFLEAGDLSTVFPDWPHEIGLVLCLDDAGTCEILLFHEDERRSVLSKAAAVFGSPEKSFAVVPQVTGWPTRKILFTDEQKLLALVEDEADLAELAADYLLDFKFRKSRKKAAAKRAKEPAAQDVSDPSPTHPRTRLAEAIHWQPRFHLSEIRPRGIAKNRTPKATIPEGYIAAGSTDVKECRIIEGTISLSHRGVRVTLGSDPVTVRTKTRLVQEICFRDDLSRFFLPAKAAEGWQPGDTLVLDIPEAKFPEGLRQRYAANARAAEITLTGYGVFVAPGAPLPPAPDENAAKVPARAFHSRLLSPLRAAVVGVICVGLTAGLVLGRSDFSALHNWVDHTHGATASDTRMALR